MDRLAARGTRLETRHAAYPAAQPPGAEPVEICGRRGYKAAARYSLIECSSSGSRSQPSGGEIAWGVSEFLLSNCTVHHRSESRAGRVLMRPGSLRLSAEQRR